MTITRITFAILALCAAFGAQAANMPAHPFVSTSGKAQLWMAPTIGELKFEAGAQNASAEVASTQLQELSASIAQLFAEHGVQEADVESYDVTKKAIPVSGQDVVAYSMGRYFRVQVRDLQQWPALLEKVMALDHIDSVASSFDRTDSDDLNAQLMSAAAADARSKGAQLAKAFGRKLGPAVAIARGPLDKVSAPFIEQQPGRVQQGTPNQGGKYSVPVSIPYSQTVNAIFMLK